MDIVDGMYKEYGEGGKGLGEGTGTGGPNQGKIGQLGNTYLLEKYPKLSFIERAVMMQNEEEEEEEEEKEGIAQIDTDVQIHAYVINDYGFIY